MELTRRRWWVGMALAVGIGLLQTVPEFLDEDEGIGSIALRSLLWVAEAPLQVLTLSLVYARCVRRGLGAATVLLVCLAVAAIVGALFALAFVFVCEGLVGVALDEKGPLAPPMVAVAGGLIGALLAGVWGLAFVSPHLAERAQRRALETEQLRLEAEQLRVASELAQLRSQLGPHFILNTLNAIAGLVTQEPREARRLLGCLGDLLRDSLRGQAELQTLEQEVTWLRRYAEILESRHGDAIRFDWDIAPEAGAVRLPHLLLQPLVENAAQHGALCRAGGGRVAVRATLRGSTLVCAVTDNGPGLPASEPRAAALGLRAVRRRLELWCPGSVLHLQSSGDGTTATIEATIEATIAPEGMA